MMSSEYGVDRIGRRTAPGLQGLSDAAAHMARPVADVPSGPGCDVSYQPIADIASWPSTGRMQGTAAGGSCEQMTGGSDAKRVGERVKKLVKPKAAEDAPAPKKRPKSGEDQLERYRWGIATGLIG